MVDSDVPRCVFLGSLDDLSVEDAWLIQAIRQQNLAAVKRAIAAGADVCVLDGYGLSALHVAALTADEAVVAELLAAGADVAAMSIFGDDNFDDPAGETPLLCMVRGMCTLMSTRRIERVSIQHIDAPIISVHRSEVLVHRVHECSPVCSQVAHVVQQLVAAGAEVEGDVGQDRDTPLYWAADLGCPTLVAALLQAGADPDHIRTCGVPILHAAARSGSREVVEQLLGALGSSRTAQLVRQGDTYQRCTWQPKLVTRRWCRRLWQQGQTGSSETTAKKQHWTKQYIVPTTTWCRCCWRQALPASMRGAWQGHCSVWQDVDHLTITHHQS
jgi:hypothetical protein